MKTNQLKIILFALFGLSLAQGCYAQTSGSHGGGFTEVELKTMLRNLAVYLKSDEGIDLFQVDINHFNQNHTPISMQTLVDVATELNPVVVHEKLFVPNPSTGFLVERDCVSGNNSAGRYFKCNADHLPALPGSQATDQIKSSFYGDMYRLAFHEVLVQVGMEDQYEREIPSNYPIAAKLSVHLELFPEWKPGKGKSPSTDAFVQNIRALFNSSTVGVEMNTVANPAWNSNECKGETLIGPGSPAESAQWLTFDTPIEFSFVAYNVLRLPLLPYAINPGLLSARYGHNRDLLWMGQSDFALLSFKFVDANTVIIEYALEPFSWQIRNLQPYALKNVEAVALGNTHWIGEDAVPVSYLMCKH